MHQTRHQKIYTRIDILRKDTRPFWVLVKGERGKGGGGSCLVNVLYVHDNSYCEFNNVYNLSYLALVTLINKYLLLFLSPVSVLYMCECDYTYITEAGTILMISTL